METLYEIPSRRALSIDWRHICCCIGIGWCPLRIPCQQQEQQTQTQEKAPRRWMHWSHSPGFFLSNPSKHVLWQSSGHRNSNADNTKMWTLKFFEAATSTLWQYVRMSSCCPGFTSRIATAPNRCAWCAETQEMDLWAETVGRAEPQYSQ